MSINDHRCSARAPRQTNTIEREGGIVAIWFARTHIRYVKTVERSSHRVAQDALGAMIVVLVLAKRAVMISG